MGSTIIAQNNTKSNRSSSYIKNSDPVDTRGNIKYEICMDYRLHNLINPYDIMEIATNLLEECTGITFIYSTKDSAVIETLSLP